MHEQFLHEDQVRREQWKHDIEEELRKADASKADSYASEFKAAMSKVSSYLTSTINLHNRMEAASAVRALYVSAQNGEKDKLYHLACALENGDVDNVRRLLSEL